MVVVQARRTGFGSLNHVKRKNNHTNKHTHTQTRYSTTTVILVLDSGDSGSAQLVGQLQVQ